MISRPDLKTVPSYYHQYFPIIPEGDFFELMEENSKNVQIVYSKNTKGEDFAYAKGKWTLKQIVSHLIDVERVMMNRIHCFVRGEKLSIPGFDHDAYVTDTDLSNKSIAGLINEFQLLRSANIAMFKNFSEEEWNRGGRANNVDFKVRTVAFIMLGHVIHHLKVIEELYYD